MRYVATDYQDAVCYSPVTALRSHNSVTDRNSVKGVTPMDSIISTQPAVSPVLPVSPVSEVVSQVVSGTPNRDHGTRPTVTPRKGRKASRATGQSLAPKRPASRAKGRANSKVRLSAKDAETLAAHMAQLETAQFPLTCKAVKAFESSASKRDAALAVARYFGENVVGGITKPLWRAKFDSQREAVSAVWAIPTDKAHKDQLTAKVQTMVRLRADGYKLLNVKPPQKSGGRPPAPIVERAVTSAQRFLKDMNKAEKLAFLAKLTDAIKASSEKKKAA